MSYNALYRKYRPKLFKEVVGQDVIIKILKSSIINCKQGHAYLFSGPRGTGKTSVAKIFAKAINCEDPIDGELCGKCTTCKELDQNDIDIIEIDAASNNGVEEIREIRSNTKLMPSIGKYKVYIIDEVHMLSTSAFNAFLKTLEEPPQHVIFILATTEPQKIPLTILSRCQRFEFKKINHKVLTERLTEISIKEKRKIDNGAIDLIAKLSDGCLRDAINLLDQLTLLNTDKVTIDDVYSLSGELKEENIINFLNSILEKNIEEGLKLINEFYLEGKNFTLVVDRLLLLLRDISINNSIDDYFDNE